MDITNFLPTGFQLRSGGGGGDPRNGMCFMETVAFIAGESVTDRPACACPILTRYGVRLNDRLDDEERQRLLPLAWAMAGTRSAPHERKRLRIICEAACDVAEMVLPFFERRFPQDGGPRAAIAAARLYWQGAITLKQLLNSRASAAAAADAYAAADPDLRARINGRALLALRDAIAAGPNGGFPKAVIVERGRALATMLAA